MEKQDSTNNLLVKFYGLKYVIPYELLSVTIRLRTFVRKTRFLINTVQYDVAYVITFSGKMKIKIKMILILDKHIAFVKYGTLGKHNI